MATPAVNIAPIPFDHIAPGSPTSLGGRFWQSQDNIYLTHDEFYSGFFFDWLSLPHPMLELSTLLESTIRMGQMPVYSHELEKWVLGKITTEQKKRFPLVAQKRDIYLVVVKLRGYRKLWAEALGALEAERDDQLADFDPEDFKKVEKESEEASRKWRAKKALEAQLEDKMADLNVENCVQIEKDTEDSKRK